jgi:hypothetical protein
MDKSVIKHQIQNPKVNVWSTKFEIQVVLVWSTENLKIPMSNYDILELIVL